VKAGFTAEGRVSAVDLYIVQDLGPNRTGGDASSAGGAVSILYQPDAMRLRDVPVFTNTTPRGAQRGPGQNQIAAVFEPIMDKAARELGIDPVDIRRRNAPDSSATLDANQGPVTSAYMEDALVMGAELFNWSERRKRSGERHGSKVTGIGVGQGYHSAGANGFDGLVRIADDGKLHIHSGCGNLGTYSYAVTARVAAEVLGCKWEDCVIERGDSRKGLPFVLGQFGSNSTYTQTRSNYVAGQDAKQKIQEIAAMDLGGKPEDYEVKDSKVFAKSDSSKSMTFAQVAKRAIALGGKYSGKEVPPDLNPITKGAAAQLAGTGLIGVAKDKLPQTGMPPALACAFVRIELDTETGKYQILDQVGVADCGTVMHPQSLHTQIRGGGVMGIGMASTERYIYDPALGLAANKGLYQCKPPTYLDVPAHTEVDAVDKADPVNPVGARGVGEPVLGASAAAVLSAISDALGGHMFNRTPVVADMIINVAAGRPQSHKPLQVNTQ
jgi:CO/xanthine dehydrogenase Mo-binding subunit